MISASSVLQDLVNAALRQEEGDIENACTYAIDGVHIAFDVGPRPDDLTIAVMLEEFPHMPLVSIPASFSDVTGIVNSINRYSMAIQEALASGELEV